LVELTDGNPEVMVVKYMPMILFAVFGLLVKRMIGLNLSVLQVPKLIRSRLFRKKRPVLLCVVLKFMVIILRSIMMQIPLTTLKKSSCLPGLETPVSPYNGLGMLENLWHLKELLNLMFTRAKLKPVLIQVKMAAIGTCLVLRMKLLLPKSSLWEDLIAVKAETTATKSTLVKLFAVYGQLVKKMIGLNLLVPLVLRHLISKLFNQKKII
jgi:hypothetical protein